MKHYRFITVIAIFATLNFVRPAGLFANTSAVPAPAPGVQSSSVSTPLDTSSASSLKVVATKVRGQVFVQHNGKGASESLLEKDELGQGDIVRTGEGLCYLSIGGKTKIFVQPNTVFSITEALKDKKTESTKLSLQSGKVKIDLPNLKNDSSFEVTTPTAVATVRGTTFYLMVGKIADKLMSQLYVDKSDGGVFFKNIFSGDSILVPHHSLSHSSADGKVEEPKELTPEEQQEFINQWESLGGASQQFGIEEIPLNTLPPPSPVLGAGFADSLSKFGLSDAFIDKLLEKTIAGQSEEVSEETSDTTTTDGGTGEETGGGETGGGETGGETGGDTELVITDAEKSMILGVVNQSIEDQEFDAEDAGLAQIEDAQTGKVFTDIHGNRVRTDQYITQPSPDSVGFLSLTLREGPYQTGLTSVYFFTGFNRPLTEEDGSFRDLPWNNYLNVVTNEDNEELTGLSAGGQYGQYIVHEYYDIPVGLDPGPDLFPEVMTLMFMSPIQAGQTDFSDLGIILFSERFSLPFRATSDQGEFWLQGREEDLMVIYHGSGESVVALHTADQPSVTVVNGVQTFNTGNERAQSAGFSSSAGIADLDTFAGVNFYRNNGIHPASVEDQFGPDRALIGYFIPFNDAGQVFDAPGFRLRSLRDVMHPNTLVNNGRYNLELLFVYGELSDGVLTNEIFRIDAIITPEIFFGSPESGPGFGLKDTNGALITGTAFPATLELDEQDI